MAFWSYKSHLNNIFIGDYCLSKVKSSISVQKKSLKTLIFIEYLSLCAVWCSVFLWTLDFQDPGYCDHNYSNHLVSVIYFTVEHTSLKYKKIKITHLLMPYCYIPFLFASNTDAGLIFIESGKTKTLNKFSRQRVKSVKSGYAFEMYQCYICVTI